MYNLGWYCMWRSGRPLSAVAVEYYFGSVRPHTGQFDSQPLWVLVERLRRHTVGLRPHRLPWSAPAGSKFSMCRMYDRIHSRMLRQLCSHLIKHEISIFFINKIHTSPERKTLQFQFQVIFTFFLMRLSKKENNFTVFFFSKIR